jgi:hypothetical protein
MGISDHASVHAMMSAALFNEPLTSPPVVLTPDGRLDELRYAASTQTAVSAFGVGYNQLDTLWLDADRFGLAVGIEGVFEWDHNTLVLVIDRDFGASTGPAQLRGAVTDTNGRIDSVLAALNVDAPAVAGFGADLALASFGGADPRLEDLIPDAGLRALHAPEGLPNDLGWYGAAINFGQDVRTRGVAAPAQPGEGFEAFIPWSRIYTGLNGAVPPNATIAIAAILVNDDGGFTSNQALPPFPATQTTNPGSTPAALPGLVTFVVDSDGDGIGDGNASPSVLP